MNLLNAPLVAQVELTKKCNHSCYYCYNYFDHSSGNMPIEGLKITLDQLIKNSVFSVILTGGKPFLNRECFLHAFRTMWNSPIDIYINTNLSQPMSKEELTALSRANLVLVSFHSYLEERFNETTKSNNYWRVIKNIENLVSQNINVGVNQVVTKRNKDEVYQTGHFIHEKFGIKSFSATPVVAVRKEDSEYELNVEEILQTARDLIRIETETGMAADILTCIPPCLFPEDMQNHVIANHGCSAGRDTIVIGSEGDVRRCTKLSQTYGNLFSEDLSIIWRKIQEVSRPKNDLCLPCNPELGCYGGCEIRAKFYGKDSLIQGQASSAIRFRKPKKLEDYRKYTILGLKSRQEATEILISNGNSFVIGNEMLLKFMKQFENRQFTLEQIRGSFGGKGEYLLNYLYEKGLVKDAV